MLAFRLTGVWVGMVVDVVVDVVVEMVSATGVNQQQSLSVMHYNAHDGNG